MTIQKNKKENKQISVLNDDIKLRINYEKEHVVRPEQKNRLGKMQLFFTIIMGMVVLFGIVYSLLSELK